LLTDLAIVVPVLFVLALAVSLVPGAAWLARGLLAIGTVCGVVLCGLQLTASGSGWVVPFGPDQDGTRFLLGTDAAWLLGFGFAAAFFVCIAGPAGAAPRGWCFGAAMSLLGAYGVGGLQDGMSFLVAYEVMSLGGAVMILADRRTKESGRPVLFMLAILEAGAVAILVAYLILTVQSGAPAFAGFQAAAEGLPDGIRVFIGLLLLAGFGAKIGIIPFYEWFPDAYGAASGATGALMSGIILNAAFFALGRGLLTWFHGSPGTMLALGIILVAIGVISAVLSALYAFQQDNWRRLLAFSSAENGSVAIALLGAAMIFAQNGSGLLAGLAWVAALIHLAAHTLAKGALFLTADGVTLAAGDDRLVQRGLLSIHTPWLGIGALIAVMSLAAMPPQAGFVSEWYLFETFFQSFHVASLAGRVALVLGGAGLALTAAIAFAVSIKVFGIGLQGSNTDQHLSIPRRYQTVVFVLGAMVLGLAVGMPVWLGQLAQAGFVVGAGAATAMRNGWLLVPLSATFSFISPSKLIIVMPLLAVLPISLLFLAMRRFPVRHPPVWYGGKQQDPLRSAVTQLTFSNAMRTFYGFVYRPRAKTERDFSGTGTENKYFIRRLNFSHDVAPIFGPYLFQPLERVVLALARTARRLQSGSLNLYLGIIGVILVIILATILF
jgi:formate hydrogenlyase subunit 3/multisubunit Na+/H+ antiporter MnhD subunit